MSFKVLQVIPKLGYGGAETGCYDVAHYIAEKNCKSYIVTSGGPLLKFIRKDKVKVFTTFHGIYNFSNSVKKFYNSVMVRSNLIIAGSNYVFNHVHKNYGYLINAQKRLLVIFRGINTEYFDNSIITNDKVQNLYSLLNLSSEKFKILLPGRLTRWKGQEMFIESLNLLKEKYKKLNFQAIILGSHLGRKVYYKKLISMIEKYNLKNDIFFLQHFSEIPVAYYISDIVVSSSIEPEAFGRVSVEAQAMRRPILASNHGGSKETIIDGKSGFLFKNNNPVSLAENLNRLMEMDKDKLQSIGNEGRKNILKKFDVEQMCNSTFLEYKKLIK